VVDGFYLEDEPGVLLKTGRFKKCSIITGTNLNEGNAFLKSSFPNDYNTPVAPRFNRIKFEQLLTSYFHYYPKYPTLASSSIQQIILYRYTNWTNPFNFDSILANLDSAVGDFNYACPCTALCDYYASLSLNVFRFFNTHLNSIGGHYKWLGVMHGEELPFVFGEPLTSTKFKTEEIDFSKILLAYWSNFMRYDDPNGGEGGGKLGAFWPKYNVTNSPDDNFQRAYLTLDASRNFVNYSLKADYCALWNNLVPNLTK
jgi:carboxylesterase type B